MLEVTGRAGISRVDLQHVAVGEILDQLARLQDGQRTLHAACVKVMDAHALPVSRTDGVCAPKTISSTLAETMMMPPTASRQPNGYSVQIAAVTTPTTTSAMNSMLARVGDKRAAAQKLSSSPGTTQIPAMIAIQRM